MSSSNRVARSLHRGLGVPVIAAACLLAVADGSASAQPGRPPATARAISGFVRDTLGTPVAGAEVRAPFGAVQTGADGRFTFPQPEEDSARVVVRKIGYEPTMATVRRAGVSRSDSNIVTLLPLIARLDRVIVEGVPYDRELWDRGFYRRQHSAQGRFFDPHDVRFFGASGLPALLHAIPRIRIERAGNQEYALGSIAGRPCRMHVYMNGMYHYAAMSSGRATSAAMSLRDIVHPDDIHAVEVYPNANTVPTQFARKGLSRAGGMRIPSPGGRVVDRNAEGDPEAPCGVIVIWTKPFVDRANAQRAKEQRQKEQREKAEREKAAQASSPPGA